MSSYTPEIIGQLGSKALAGGVTLLCVLSDDPAPFSASQQQVKGSSPCDFGVLASPTQVNIQEPQLSVTGLFLSLPSQGIALEQLSAIFERWPENRPLMAKATGAYLASVLFFASLYGRPVHISQVSTKQDLLLIIASKEKGLQVTCDVSVFSLFFTKQDFPHADLGTKEDLEAIWANIDSVECFSSGDVARQLSRSEKRSPFGRLEDMLPLLLTAVTQNHLTLKTLIQKIYENPLKILSLAPQPSTFVTVEIDREATSVAAAKSTPTKGEPSLLSKLRGVVTRVVVRDQTMYLDGHLLASAGAGREMVRDPVLSSEPLGPRVKRRKMSLISDQHDVAPSPLLITSAVSGPPQPLLSSSSLTPMDVGSPPRKQSVDGDVKDSKFPVDWVAKSTLRRGTQATSGFYRQHVTTVDKFARGDLHAIFGVAQEMKTLLERNVPIDLLRGKVTRTPPATFLACSSSFFFFCFLFPCSTRSSAIFSTSLRPELRAPLKRP